MSSTVPLDEKHFQSEKVTLFDTILSRPGSRVEERPLNLPRPCWVCHKPGKLLCSACLAGVYCSKECQKNDWEDVHKSSCKSVKRALKKVRREADIISNNPPDSFGWEGDLFQHGGHFWGIFETRDYMRARFGLTKEYRMAFGGKASGVEVAMLHLLQMMFLCHSDNLGIRDQVPFLMIAQGYIQEAQSLISYWADLKRLDKEFSEVELLLKSRAPVNYQQDIDTLCGQFAMPSSCVNAAFALFCTWHRATLLETIRASILPPGVAELVVGFVYQPFVHEPKESPQDLKVYLDKYLDCINENSETMLKGLVNPGPALSQPLPSYMSPGSFEETQSVVIEAEEALSVHPAFSKYIADSRFNGNTNIQY